MSNHDIRTVEHDEAGLRSGQLADAAGVNVQTLRYYERRGLLAEPDRSLGGHRLYPPHALEVLRVIKAAQRMGFTLEEHHRHREPRGGQGVAFAEEQERHYRRYRGER